MGFAEGVKSMSMGVDDSIKWVLNKWYLYRISDGRKEVFVDQNDFECTWSDSYRLRRGSVGVHGWCSDDEHPKSVRERANIGEQQLLKYPCIEFAPMFSPRYVAHRCRPQHTRKT